VDSDTRISHGKSNMAITYVCLPVWTPGRLSSPRSTVYPTCGFVALEDSLPKDYDVDRDKIEEDILLLGEGGASASI
jgi:hypothetical protein